MPASLTFVHPYPEIRSNPTSISFSPSNQTVVMSQDELGHFERSLSFKGERGDVGPSGSLQPPRGNLNCVRSEDCAQSYPPPIQLFDTFLSPLGLLRHNLAVRSIENRVQSCALNLAQPPFPTTNTSIPLPRHSKSSFKNKAEGQEEEVRELGALILINEVRVPSSSIYFLVMFA